MGKVGELVQVAGHTFELGHEVEMFAAQTLAHTTGSYQLPKDFRARPTGSTCQCLKSQFMFRVEAEGYSVFLFSGFAQRRALARMFGVLHGFDYYGLDHRDESRKASFWLTKTQTCITIFSYPACVWAQYVVGTVSPANTRSNPYAPDKGATGR